MMVLSGANITLFITFISSLLFFLPQRIRGICAIIATLFFLSMIPLQPSIVRAALMNIIPRIGSVFGRKSHNLYLLFFSCALILLFDSNIVYDISFQLSFLAIFGIALFYKEKENPDQDKNIVSILANTLKNQILLGFSAQVFTVPLIFYYFGNISLLSPIANLILSPFISPIMVLCILTVSLNIITPELSQIIAYLLHIMTGILISIIHLLSQYKSLYIHY